jgi:hypothetical protein
MKAAIVKVIFAVMSIAVFGCAEEAATPEDPFRLNFKINPTEGNVTDLPPEASLLISMESETGEPLYSLENIAYTKTPEGFTTTGLDVTPGNYTLTEFMLVDGTGKMLYTIPYEASPLTQSVNKPLGISLQVSANNATELGTEVLDVGKHKPSDFGLASFNTTNSFQVIIAEKGSSKAVEASAVIMHGNDIVTTMNVPAKKTRISFGGEPNETYKIIINRGACAPYVTEFTLSDWAKEYRTKALKISLEPAFTMVGQTDADAEVPFYFYIGAAGADLIIDWGDGSVETRSINEPGGEEVTHPYAVAGSYPITITGDLDKIVHFYSFYGGSVFSEIHFRRLINLKELLYGLTHCPAVVDLSYNTKLEHAMLPSLLDLEQLILPAKHQLAFLEVDGGNRLDAADVNAIISNLYTNTSAANRRDGILGLRAYWAQPEDDMTMIGPPSAASLVLLESLRNDYGWIVRPGESGGKLSADGRISARRRI